MQLAGWLGSLTAPILFGWVSGYVLAIGGVINLLGLAIAAPILSREWRRLQSAKVPAYDQLEALDEARPAAAAQPPSAIE